MTRASTAIEVGAPTTFVDGYLAYNLVQACAHVARPFHRDLRRQGVLLTEWQVLACLVDRPDLSLKDLERLCLVPQSNLSRVVARMTARGWIERGEGATDRRRRRLRLTEAGDARASALVAAARAQESRAVGCLSAAERRSLAGLLARLIAANP